MKTPIELVLSTNIASTNIEKPDKAVDFDSIVNQYGDQLFTQYRVQLGKDGFYFLDTWLDAGDRRVILYIEITLDDEPINGGGECVSAFLLNYTDYTAAQDVVAIHRPVKWDKDNDSLDYVIRTTLLWGMSQAKEIEYIWLAGVTAEERTAILMLLPSLEFSINADCAINLDLIVGETQNSRAAICVCCAIEQAQKSNKPQLVIYQAACLQLLVVRPINDRQPA